MALNHLPEFRGVIVLKLLKVIKSLFSLSGGTVKYRVSQKNVDLF